MDSPEQPQAPAGWETLKQAEMRFVMERYRLLGRNKTRTAGSLGISHRGLYVLLHRWADAGLITREEAGIR